jgi:hypothetical protein
MGHDRPRARDRDAPPRAEHTQLCEWARRRPQEVPLLDGEFEFITVTTLEVADAVA